MSRYKLGKIHESAVKVFRKRLEDQAFLPKSGEFGFTEEMKLVDFAPRTKGFVSMFDCPLIGKPVLFHQGANLCVYNSRQILANLMATGKMDTSSFYINKAKFGNRGVANDQIVENPSAPIVTDEALAESPSNIETVDGLNFTVDGIVSRPDSNAWAITYRIVFDRGVGFGVSYKQYTEVGIFSDNDTLYARKTFPSYIKTTDRKLITLWTIVF